MQYRVVVEGTVPYQINNKNYNTLELFNGQLQDQDELSADEVDEEALVAAHSLHGLFCWCVTLMCMDDGRVHAHDIQLVKKPEAVDEFSVGIPVVNIEQ